MKNQFSIKPVQVLKNVAKSATKMESNNILKFVLSEGGKCCEGYTIPNDIVAVSR